MPYYPQEENQGKKSRSERKRLARERAILRYEENRYLSMSEGSKLIHFFWYPLTALVTALTTLWLHYALEDASLFDVKFYIAPLIFVTTLTLTVSYIKDENYFKPQLARIREPAVAIELSRKEKFSNRETRLERLQIVKEKVAGIESAYYSVFINNTIFYALLTLAYSYFLKVAQTNFSYPLSILTASISQLLFVLKDKKKDLK